MVLRIIIVRSGATILAMMFMNRSLSVRTIFAVRFTGAVIVGAICGEFVAPAQAMLFHPVSALVGACALIWQTNRSTRSRS